MLLQEFFGKPLKLSKEQDKSSSAADDVFWFILDHDKLHKDYFFPIAKKMQIEGRKKESSKKQCIEDLKSMVNHGCMEFYHTKKLKGKPKNLFPKELRDDLCERLFNHYSEGIKKGEYNLG
jgi:hypothetical protein